MWADRLETNRTVTIPACFRRCEETGRIDNFAKAAGRMPGDFVGIPFDDSDVYKAIEGASYSLAMHPDPELDRYLDGLIETIASAQESDGYLYTCRTINTQALHPRAGPQRWLNEMGAVTGEDSHELYNVGHLYEAAVAHHEATGKRTLLDVALRSADLVASVWCPDGLHIPSGHQEIEIGLVKLSRVTGERRYLDLAKFLLDQRGRGGPAVLCDHLPVIQQREALGHAVRAGYMYAAMADVAALTGDSDYLAAVDALWENVVGRKLYLTGGIGARRDGEQFGGDYELPNVSAYAETCAAIANCLWNHRMFLLHGDARYMDVFERTLYNGLLAGVSLDGDRFFYPNPLAADGKEPFNHGATGRQPWFDCSCCPVNVARFLPEIVGCVYAAKEANLYVNLFIASKGEFDLPGGRVRLTQVTDYPWSGRVTIRVDPERAGTFALCVRIPGWARGEVVPSDLYRFADKASSSYHVAVNGQPTAETLDKGYATLVRRWQAGDTMEVEFGMDVRQVEAHLAVSDCLGKLALTRGPLVYCVEGVDHNGDVDGLRLDHDAPMTVLHVPELLGGSTVLRGKATCDGIVVPFQAVPYALWNHRGDGPMAVWLRTAQGSVSNARNSAASRTKASVESPATNSR